MDMFFFQGGPTYQFDFNSLFSHLFTFFSLFVAFVYGSGSVKTHQNFYNLGFANEIQMYVFLKN